MDNFSIDLLLKVHYQSILRVFYRNLLQHKYVLFKSSIKISSVRSFTLLKNDKLLLFLSVGMDH